MINKRTYMVTWTNKYTNESATDFVNMYHLTFDYLVDDTIIIHEIRISDDDFSTNRVDDYLIRM